MQTTCACSEMTENMFNGCRTQQALTSELLLGLLSLLREYVKKRGEWADQRGHAHLSNNRQTQMASRDDFQ